MVHRIVVGAAGFIGRPLAAHFAAQPGHLLLIDSDPAGPPAGTVRGWHVVDCRSERFKQLVDAFVDGAERVELFHAAGRVPHLARIATNDVDAFRAAIEDNLVTTYAVLRTVAEAAAAHRIPGALLVLGSVGGTRAHRYKAGYDAAKAAAESLTRSFALEYGPLHISTRAIAIGPIDDSSTTSADGVHLDALVRDVPLQRYATLAEVVHAVAALATPVFDFANGATYLFDGGLTQQLRSEAVERPPEDLGVR
ncbi:SDR family oxidoreductase [Streptomyces sp. NBC_01551]|uniref:SDR family oxidoreductase n=1 Tax=Streptomyces sp. NBC_01551 TaxID=2975876 RepID=UPI00224E850A|nr:SDR family oxidoreductase [Streptomyces sp. NBC_01551]MCX4529521.1 SDR family oxidoreductase [Streptomyces sp. NBC_01551]